MYARILLVLLGIFPTTLAGKFKVLQYGGFHMYFYGKILVEPKRNGIEYKFPAVHISFSGDGSGRKLMSYKIVARINAGIPVFGYLRAHVHCYSLQIGIS